MSGSDAGNGNDGDAGRTLLVDASAFITLAEIDGIDLLRSAAGQLATTPAIRREVSEEPAAAALERAVDGGTCRVATPSSGSVTTAASHLGVEMPEMNTVAGDVSLLATALDVDSSVVVISDDKPLRNTCKTLSIPVSGSIGVLVRAVERDDVGTETATRKLYAMDESGARLSATLVRRAERLIEEAAPE